MNFVKKHKVQVIGLAVFGVLMVMALFAVIHLLYPDTSASYYGNRLEGIEKVKIKEDTLKEMATELKKNEKIKEVKTDIKGRITSVIIDVKKNVDLVTAKGFADKVLTFFTKEQKEYYDIELFLTCQEDEKSEIYPKAGYKHKTSINFKWTN